MTKTRISLDHIEQVPPAPEHLIDITAAALRVITPENCGPCDPDAERRDEYDLLVGEIVDYVHMKALGQSIDPTRVVVSFSPDNLDRFMMDVPIPGGAYHEMLTVWWDDDHGLCFGS